MTPRLLLFLSLAAKTAPLLHALLDGFGGATPAAQANPNLSPTPIPTTTPTPTPTPNPPPTPNPSPNPNPSQAKLLAYARGLVQAMPPEARGAPLLEQARYLVITP